MNPQKVDPFLARAGVSLVLTSATGAWLLDDFSVSPVALGILLIGWMVDIVVSTRHGDQEAVLGHGLGFMLGMVYLTVLVQSTEIHDTFHDTAPVHQEH